ncbi:DUF1572 family protein [Winogradskyella sp. 3972H.M.0a.05]|uniref:DUF1572 family protein n=1 Tax=Winogradskyella sp. 3972H.M.0a.05 TaxID=2950277 RepID=UPI003390C5C6
MEYSYLPSVIKQFEYYKSLGDKTIAQLTDEQLHWQQNEDSNSIAIIVKHIAGNMLSRWTNFLTEDGEKEWRNRDDEFIDSFNYREDLINYWNKGWNCLFDAIKPLNENDLGRIIYIRNHGHTVTEAVNRQMMHYAYHIGQIVFVGKLIKGRSWQTLSIAKGQSTTYNSDKFSKDKRRTHFTDDL